MLLFNLLSDASENPPNYSTWIMLGLLVIIFGVMMWTSSRSNKKRAKEAQEKLDKMKVGDRVKTIGGICGIIVEINEAENTFVLETGNEKGYSYIKFDKVAVYETAPVETVTEPEAFSDTDAVETVTEPEAFPTADEPVADETVADTVEDVEENSDKTNE